MRALITTQPRSREGDHPVPVSPKFVGEEEGGAGNEDAAVESSQNLSDDSRAYDTSQAEDLSPI